jgi:cyclopropane fatty-acyl-phospholipid synthase-like methyltransferase
MNESKTRQYFEAMYARDDDPWRLRQRWYERRKRELIVAMLPRERYRSAFEPGCANGELSTVLAGRCDALLAVDLHAGAVRAARSRLAHCPNVRVEVCAVPHQWPAGTVRFDLVVISEFAYYLDPDELDMLAARVQTSLDNDGCLLACDWRRPFAHRQTSAEAVHACFASRCDIGLVAHHVEADMLIDVWTRDGRSVAENEKLV